MGYRSVKGFKLETALKTVQTMRKSLIEASTQAMLTADELEDAAYMGMDDEDAIRMGAEPDYEVAMKACKEAEQHIKSAIEATEEAKIALRNGMAVDPDLDDEAVHSEEVAPALRKALRIRRHQARISKK